VPDSLDPIAQRQSGRTVAILALVIALVALGVSLWQMMGRNSGGAATLSGPTRWQRIKSSGTVRVGYGGYPPYTIIDPNQSDPSKRVSGFSIDLVNAIASRTVPPLKVEWVHFAFDAMKADLDSDRFDFIADPVFQTIPRAADFAFTEPYSYFGIATAVVRPNENRFKTFSDLDRPDITIALAEGWTSSEFARANLKKPKFKSIPVTGDAFNQLDEVIFGRADVALNDVPTVLQYTKAHKGKVKALWLTTPPSSVAGGFLVRYPDTDLVQFLNTGIRVLRADGTIDLIDKKWKSLGFLPVQNVRPGAGLSSSDAAGVTGSR